MTPSSDAVVLIGPMGAGKTSIGRRVAKRLSVGFVDTDAEIARANGPIPQIFAARGEAHFRMLERAAVREALAAGGVVSLGGGAPLHPETRRELAAHRVILLTVTPEVVAGRLREGARPLLDGVDALSRWNDIWAIRRPVYEDLADVRFDTSRGPLSAVVDAVAAWAEEHPRKEPT
jgi:shikimate kinase